MTLSRSEKYEEKKTNDGQKPNKNVKRELATKGGKFKLYFFNTPLEFEPYYKVTYVLNI